MAHTKDREAKSVDLGDDIIYSRRMFRIKLLLMIGITMGYSLHAQARPKRAFQAARIGEGTDAVSCGSSDWKPFEEAVVFYCKKPSSDEESCKDILLPAFSACGVKDEIIDGGIQMTPMSKKQIRRIQRLEYRFIGEGGSWTVRFIRTKQGWSVFDTDVAYCPS